MSLKRRWLKCRLTDDKFPTLQKKPKCRTCDGKVSKIRHDDRRIFGQNVVVVVVEEVVGEELCYLESFTMDGGWI